MEPIVIIGGGHAAAQLCSSLVEAGQGARLHLVSAEGHVPYHRPPLSKAYLKNLEEAAQPLRPEAWYAEAGITLHLADPAVSLDRAARTVTLRSGKLLPYGQMVLATGTRPRRMHGWPATLDNVLVLRDLADAGALRNILRQHQRLTVLGGGFIGLEVAATARGLGLDVTVLESAQRLLARSVSAEISAHVQATHEAAGMQLRLGVAVGGAEFAGNRLAALHADGQPTPVDLLLLGIGAEPETTLAQAAGLEVGNGVLVDGQLLSSDPHILAMGDCANFPEAFPEAIAGTRRRLESVQNANDQARTAAATLLGRNEPYRALPWFWSEQGGLRLQMAGLLPAGTQAQRRPGASPASFSLFHYLGDRLVCVESVNAPMDHIQSRKLMEAGRHPAPAQVADPAVALKTLI